MLQALQSKFTNEGPRLPDVMTLSTPTCPQGALSEEVSADYYSLYLP